MNQQLWIAILTFLAAAIAAATQMLPIPANIIPFMAYAVAVINLALGIFFGVQGWRARAKSKAAK